jgi:hypothetical protein
MRFWRIKLGAAAALSLLMTIVTLVCVVFYVKRAVMTSSEAR